MSIEFASVGDSAAAPAAIPNRMPNAIDIGNGDAAFTKEGGVAWLRWPPKQVLAQPAQQDSRAEFEAWFLNKHGQHKELIERHGDGYWVPSTQDDWETWQAARSAPRPVLTDERLNEIYREAFGLVDSRLVGDQIKFARLIERAVRDNCGNCWKCMGADWMPNRMLLCPTCGNKRCPKATDHTLDCTNSNEQGQAGSAYGAGVTTPIAAQTGERKPAAWLFVDGVHVQTDEPSDKTYFTPLYGGKS